MNSPPRLRISSMPLEFFHPPPKHMWYAGAVVASVLLGPSVVGGVLRGTGATLSLAVTSLTSSVLAPASTETLAAERVSYARDMGRTVCDRYRQMGFDRSRVVGSAVAAIERVLDLLDAAVRGGDRRTARLWADEVLDRIGVLRNVASLTASEGVLVDALLEF